jgi:hypothetical protein
MLDTDLSKLLFVFSVSVEKTVSYDEKIKLVSQPS